ncbi:enoyl-CoA hydratase/isomerase family protein [Streptomyces sp. CA-210063]|uniref:enoyl-CoA hydratase/isomerase family protein n=1 Tax=Streptomyces sp. CA-210063 TaxID=2801029 RepID=UPI003FA6BB83
MEIVVGGDDFPAQLAAEYGYVNRVLPEGELDDFADTFARRIAGFSKAGVAGAKEFVDAATAIPAGDHAAALAAFRRTAMRPENADHLRSLARLLTSVPAADGGAVRAGPGGGDGRRRGCGGTLMGCPGLARRCGVEESAAPQRLLAGQGGCAHWGTTRSAPYGRSRQGVPQPHGRHRAEKQRVQ